MRYQAGGQDALLIWAQTIASQQRVPVTNWTSSWKSGLALCAIVEYYHDGGINFSSLDVKQSEKNLELALSVAEGDGVPRLLDADDFCVGVPDRRSVITYISCMYQIYRLKLSQIQSVFGGPVRANGPLSPLPPMKSTSPKNSPRKRTVPRMDSPKMVLRRQNSNSPSRTPLQQKNLNQALPAKSQLSPKVTRVARASPTPPRRIQSVLPSPVVAAPSAAQTPSVKLPTKGASATKKDASTKVHSPAKIVQILAATQPVKKQSATAPKLSPKKKPFIANTTRVVAESKKQEEKPTPVAFSPAPVAPSTLSESLAREEARMMRQMHRALTPRKPLSKPVARVVQKPTPTATPSIVAPTTKLSIATPTTKPPVSRVTPSNASRVPVSVPAPAPQSSPSSELSSSPIRGIRNNPFILAEKQKRSAPQCTKPIPSVVHSSKKPVWKPTTARTVTTVPLVQTKPPTQMPKPASMESKVTGTSEIKHSPKKTSPQRETMSRQERRMQSMIDQQCQLYARKTIQKKPSPVQPRSQRQRERDQIRAELQLHEEETKRLQASRKSHRKVSKDILSRASQLLSPRD